MEEIDLSGMPHVALSLGSTADKLWWAPTLALDRNPSAHCSTSDAKGGNMIGCPVFPGIQDAALLNIFLSKCTSQ